MKVFPTDYELIEKLRRGDVDAFDQVYMKYAGKLYSFSLKYLKSKEEAEELVQSVFLKVWENQRNLKSEHSFKSYLFTIAYNEICNLFRQRDYRRKFMESSLLSNNESSGEAEAQIDAQFVQEQLDRIIAKLPEKQRVIFKKAGRKENQAGRSQLNWVFLQEPSTTTCPTHLNSFENNSKRKISCCCFSHRCFFTK